MPKARLPLPTRSPGEKKKSRGRPFDAGNTMGKGRPKGSLNKTTLLIQYLLNEHAPEVAQKVIALAKAGDPNAIRIVMDRVSPVRTGAPITWKMPVIRDSSDIPAAYSSLLQAVAEGDMSPAEALQVKPILDAAAKAFDDFEMDPAWQPDTTRATVEHLTETQEEVDNAETAEARQRQKDAA